MGDARRLLIVEHEPRAAVDMARVLRSAGYEVLEAPSARECLILARQTRPQLILVDEALADVSGIDLARQIKRDAELSPAYVALLSRETTASAIRARALENGVDDVIVRSSLTREFLARIEALLRRQASEDSLRTALQDYRATFDAMSEAVYLVNLDFKIIDCNLAMARLLAKPRGEIVGGRCYELVHGTGKPIPACLGQRVRESRRHESLVVPMEDRWLQVDVDPLMDASGAVVGSVHILRDITEQRHTEETLQHTQTELELHKAEHQLAMDKANLTLQTELQSRARVQELLKGTQANLELRNSEYDVLAQTFRTTEETLQRVRQELGTVSAQATDLVYSWDVHSGQARLLSDSAGRFAAGFPATLAKLNALIHPDDRKAVKAELAQHVAAGTPWNAEYRVLDPQGQVAHWAVSAAPLGETGTREWLAVVRDVTALRRTEREGATLREGLYQTQKMGALRRLALGAANEFNRLLGTILGQLEMILARIEPTHPLYDELQAIARAARLGTALIRQLLAFAGREAVQPVSVDVNALLPALEPDLQRSAGKGVELQWELAPRVSPVLADPRVLQDIWLNLAARAAAALPRGGVLRVATADVALDDACVRPRAVPAGDYVRVTMAYRDPTPPAELQQGLFELQFTAADTGAGGELGLGVVSGLVQQLGGFIEMTQTAAKETAWEVYLPAYLPVDEEWEGLGEEEPAGGEAPLQESVPAEQSAPAVASPAVPQSETLEPRVAAPATPEPASTAAVEEAAPPGAFAAEPEPVAPDTALTLAVEESASPVAPAAEPEPVAPDTALTTAGAETASPVASTAAPGPAAPVDTAIVREPYAPGPVAPVDTAAVREPYVPGPVELESEIVPPLQEGRLPGPPDLALESPEVESAPTPAESGLPTAGPPPLRDISAPVMLEPVSPAAGTTPPALRSDVPPPARQNIASTVADTPARTAPRLPDWLTEVPDIGDITEPPADAPDAPQEASGDITEEQPSSSGRFGFGSRLRQRLGRGGKG